MQELGALELRHCSHVLRTNKQRQVGMKSFPVKYCPGFMELIAFGFRALCSEQLKELVLVRLKVRQL